MTTYKTRAEYDASIAKLMAERDKLPPRPRYSFFIIEKNGDAKSADISARIRDENGYESGTYARLLMESDFAPPEEVVIWATAMVAGACFRDEAKAADYILHMDKIAKETGE